MTKNFLLLLIILLTVSFRINAQHISMKVSDVETADPDMKQQMDGLFKSMKMDVYNTDKVNVTTINMMNGMSVMSTYAWTDDPKTIIYAELMGNKTKVVPTTEEIAQMKADNESKAKEFTLTEVPGSNKTVLGYDCKKYLLKSPEMEMILYVAPDLKISTRSMQGFDGMKLEGFPLQYVVDAAGNKITFTADKIEMDFDKSKLDEPKGNYKEMTFSEFKKSLPGM